MSARHALSRSTKKPGLVSFPDPPPVIQTRVNISLIHNIDPLAHAFDVSFNLELRMDEAVATKLEASDDACYDRMYALANIPELHSKPTQRKEVEGDEGE